jgi:hypothetical protein
MTIEVYDSAPDVTQAYMDLLGNFGVTPDLANWARQYAASHAGRCLWDARFLLRHHRIARLLNIGGAPYLFETALKHENPAIDIVTIDLDPVRFPGVAETLGIRVIQGDIESPDWDLDEEFDCIVFAEIFEHLRIDLLGTLARVRQNL